MPDPAHITFGLVAPSDEAVLGQVTALARRVAEKAGAAVDLRSASSYEDLATDVREGNVDLAWLPPIVFLRLRESVEPIGSIRRGGQSSYEAALVVRADSKLHAIDSLQGTRAGWVDRWSAAGFVVPRIKLALLGVDPRTAFRSERFFGSHAAAVRALVDGAVDVVGTHGRAGEDGEITRGAWTDIEGADVRVLTSFGAIPPDILATRAGIDPDVRGRIASGFSGAAADADLAALLRDVFGGDELVLGVEAGYEALESALDVASARGLFD